jgi:hypothetical protein
MSPDIAHPFADQSEQFISQFAPGFPAFNSASDTNSPPTSRREVHAPRFCRLPIAVVHIFFTDLLVGARLAVPTGVLDGARVIVPAKLPTLEVVDIALTLYAGPAVVANWFVGWCPAHYC